MKAYRDLGIRQKLDRITLSICGVVLMVALAAFFTFQVLNFRSNFQRDNTTLATIIANHSSAAMAFKDEQAATEILDALKAKPTIISASLVLADGSVLAHYGESETPQARSDFPALHASRFLNGQLLLSEPVIAKRDPLGALFLRSDYRTTFLSLLNFYGRVVLGVVSVSVALGVLLSSRLGRTITNPILELDRTAQIVGEKKDYSVRAQMGQRGDELGRLTRSFNEMLGRIQSQDAALSLSQQKMETLVNSIDGIVWERSAEDAGFTFISRQSEAILGYPPATWQGQPNFWAQKLHPQDAAKTIETAHGFAARGQSYTFEYRMIAADGRTVWIRESGTVLAENGRPVAVRGIMQDITRQKVDAEELDKLTRQLIDASRQAGMAEVATGVLHNVGNVLNSVSVAATVVSNRLRESKLANLRRATAMLAEQNGRVAEYLTSDPKGKLLPEYFGVVTEQLTEEHERLLSKMESVTQNIEHIKEIVAMQQSFARVSGAYESLSAVDLVENALRINVAAFDRHGIEIARDFEAGLPPVFVDRHKVLQILINLLSNAKHAVDDMASEDKRLIIRVARGSAGRVKIFVCDNGIGIPAENLTRIFNHGFTTKKTGHGFGLHSGANAAKEMGGSLEGHSDGPGKGAEFTLELPTPLEPAGRPDAAQTRQTLVTQPT